MPVADGHLLPERRLLRTERGHALSARWCATGAPRALAALALLGACGESPAARLPDAAPADAAAHELLEVSLLDPEAFVYADLGADPLVSHQPEEIRCGLSGFYPERGELELDTGGCNYLYLEQPAPHAVPAGSEVHLSLRHFDLAAPELAEAHVALLFGDTLQWEKHVEIPGGANVYEVSWQSSEALERGSPIRLHLHNHGQNTWTLGALGARVPPP